MVKSIATSLFFLIAAVNIISAQTEYKNEQYGFNIKVPVYWKVYAEIKHDPASKKVIIDWGLPKVYSELEKTSIENAVSITAYKRPALKSIEDVAALEFERIGNMLKSKKLLNSQPYTSYIVYTERNGLKYKSKVVFVFQNGIGYVISFTATPGTYDINLSKFDQFVNSITFLKPSESENVTSKSTIRFDGLYVAKTAEINIPNNKMEIYTYIRFYDDGTVYTQAVNSYNPKSVIEWLGKNGRFERKGTYTTKGANINFTVTNEESADRKLEGPKTNTYTGTITDGSKLYLNMKYDDQTEKSFWFEFASPE